MLGQQVEMIDVSNFWSTIFRWKVRSLAVHERGLAIQRGSGLEHILWAELAVLSSFEVVRVHKVSGREDLSQYVFSISFRNHRTVKVSSSQARRCHEKITPVIVRLAGLEWVRLTPHSPPMAVQPEVAKRLQDPVQ